MNKKLLLFISINFLLHNQNVYATGFSFRGSTPKKSAAEPGEKPEAIK